MKDWPSQNNVTFKNWIPLISTSRKKVIFLKKIFFLILIIVSTSRSKSCKTLFCLGEKGFFSINSILFASGNHYWNYAEANFYRQTSLFLVETAFLASEKPFFPFIRYSRQWKQFLPQMETLFLTNSSFQLVETNFLSSRNSIVIFRALLKILNFGGSNLFKRNLTSAVGSWFFG